MRRRDEVTQALVLGTHNRIGYAVARSLAEAGVPVTAGATTVAGMARFSRYPSSHLVYPHPRRSPEGFIDALEEHGREAGQTVLVPTGSETLLVAKAWDRLGAWYAAVLPRPDLIEKVIDKLFLAEVAAELGVPHPETRLAAPDRAPAAYPAVVKPRQGAGGWLVTVCRDEREYQAAVAKVLEHGAVPVVQPFAGSETLGVAMLFAHGREVARFSQRVILTMRAGGGTPVLRTGRPEPEAEQALSAVLTRLEWHGVAQADFVAGGDGVPLLVDLNPRFWGSLYCATASGVNFPALYYRIALGLPVTPPAVARQGLTSGWAWGTAFALLHRLFGRGPRFRRSFRLSKVVWDDLTWADPIPTLVEPVSVLAHNLAGRGSRPQWTEF